MYVLNKSPDSRFQTTCRIRARAILSASAFTLLVLPATSGAAQSTADEYTYDSLGRLSKAQTGQGVKSSYSYDPASNRSSVIVNKDFEIGWEAENLPHAAGYAEYAGWGANPSVGAAHITYGPYTTNVAVGSRVAAWKILIKDNGDQNEDIAYLDVFDSTTGTILAGSAVKRNLFSATMTYKVIELPFILDSSRSGHSLEFRTYYTGVGTINIDKIGIF